MECFSKKCQCSIKIENLVVKGNKHLILKSLSLQANHGEILALIGRNGSGKTTVLKAILKRVPFQGKILFFDSNGQKILNPKIGYVPQCLNFEKNTPISVLDFLSLNLTNFPVWLFHKKKIKEKVFQVLDKIGVSNLISKTIGSLSGGELQRILLAFALEPKPDILILDEPSSALDRKGVAFFYSLITSMRNEFHMPIILVSHDLQQIKEHASKYAIIERGKIIETGYANKLNSSSLATELFGI
ncbi:MAG: metal ABC transporter ATP-binding protein [Oscillospiraceae bacterium]|jgi:zinc transport system ATP-binding protein|nr:metal ABC transporter ATP-binding protein [Oscillospiraceae bacterium]